MSQKKLVIGPEEAWGFEWEELKKSSELLYYFIWRNYKVRYKQTLIGAAWAVLKPIILMVVFTLAFNKIADIETESKEIPYTIFAYTGLIFWTYFSQTVNQIGNSLVSFQGIIKKVYFPRILIPLSTALTGLVDFGLSALIYVVMMLAYQISPTTTGILMFIPCVLITLITTFGMGSFVAAMNIKYRDVGQALPFLIQTLLFLTPVVYPVTLVPDKFKWIMFVNPLTGVVDTMQAGLLDLRPISWAHLQISILSSVVLLVGGLWFFKRREREFADVI